MCNYHTLELPATAGAYALLPARGPDDNLTVSDGKRILCQPMMIDHNQMFLGAFGPEQTKIVYTFAKIVADFQVLKIRSVCTSRSDGGAGSYIMLGDICGEADRLLA